MEPCRVGEREKGLKSFFEKTSQIRFFKNLIHEFQLIEKQFRLIETDRGSQKILNAISIDRKTDWINRKSGKTTF